MDDQERDEKIGAIHNVLLGVDGYPGLAARFEELAKSHYQLKRLVYTVFAFFAGSGILGGGIWGIIHALTNGN